jgi:anti-anti-sigma regulatory factor
VPITDPTSAATTEGPILSERCPPPIIATAAEALGLLLDDSALFAEAQALLVDVTGCTLRRAANALLLTAAHQHVDAMHVAQRFVLAMTIQPERSSDPLVVYLVAVALSADTTCSAVTEAIPSQAQPRDPGRQQPDLGILTHNLIESASIGSIRGFRAHGELDLSTADELLRVATDIRSTSAGGTLDSGVLFVDLENVTFIDVAGLGALAGIINHARDYGLQLLVSTPTAAGPRKLLAMAVNRDWIVPDFSPTDQTAPFPARLRPPPGYGRHETSGPEDCDRHQVEAPRLPADDRSGRPRTAVAWQQTSRRMTEPGSRVDSTERVVMVSSAPRDPRPRRDV